MCSSQPHPPPSLKPTIVHGSRKGHACIIQNLDRQTLVPKILGQLVGATGLSTAREATQCDQRHACLERREGEWRERRDLGGIVSMGSTPRTCRCLPISFSLISRNKSGTMMVVVMITGVMPFYLSRARFVLQTTYPRPYKKMCLLRDSSKSILIRSPLNVLND